MDYPFLINQGKMMFLYFATIQINKKETNNATTNPSNFLRSLINIQIPFKKAY